MTSPSVRRVVASTVKRIATLNLMEPLRAESGARPQRQVSADRSPCSPARAGRPATLYPLVGPPGLALTYYTLTPRPGQPAGPLRAAGRRLTRTVRCAGAALASAPVAAGAAPGKAAAGDGVDEARRRP